MSSYIILYRFIDDLELKWQVTITQHNLNQIGKGIPQNIRKKGVYI